MFLAWSTVGCASAQSLDRRLDIFDAHAAALPSHFSLPDPAGERQVALLRKLPADLEIDGKPASVFVARIDGRPGTIARVGDGLDIVLDDEEPLRAVSGGPIDRVIDGSEDPPPPGHELRGRARATVDAAPKAIEVWVFLHETAGENDPAKFVNWYLTWWAKDMEDNVTPGVPVRVRVHSKAPGLTDMDYHTGTDADRIRDVGLRGAEFARSRGARVTSLTKFVLFIDEPARNWEPGTLGGAVERYGAAIASNRGHRHIFAHEVGHLLAARHEDAEHRFFCITNMKDSLWGAASCRYYSQPNNENIRRYVSARANP